MASIWILHELFNIHLFRPKDQIMEKTTSIEHIKDNDYMQFYFLQKLFEGLFHYSQNIFHN